jgi:hypothetical protein
MTDSAVAAEPSIVNVPAGRASGMRVWLAVLALLLALPHVPGLDSDYGRSLLTQMGIAAVFALSFNILFGQTGLLSFGHAVYFGLGGYAAIHFMRAINHGLPVPIVLVPLAGAAGGLVACCSGCCSDRSRPRRRGRSSRSSPSASASSSTRRRSCCRAFSAARKGSPRAERAPRRCSD